MKEKISDKYLKHNLKNIFSTYQTFKILIVIIQNDIKHYRRELFNKLTEIDSITVFHSGKVATNNEDLFFEISTKQFKLGPFLFHKKLFQNIKKLSPKFIIAPLDIRNISTIFSYFF